MYEEIYESPIGKIKIEADEQNITQISFVTTAELNNVCKKEIKPANDIVKECKKQLQEYFEGKRKEFNIKYKLNGTEFQKEVWEEISKIQYGKTVSYKEVAKRIRKEKAVRAVANAIGKNNIVIIIPCHRIIGSNGKLTGFSAKTDDKTGVELKQELLELEGNKEWK